MNLTEATMRYWMIGCLCWLCAMGTAWADTPSVGDDPSEAWRRVKAVVDTLQPSADALWNTLDGDWHPGLSARLVGLDRLGVPHGDLVDLRLGWAETKIATLGFSTDVGRLSGQRLPMGRFVHVGWFLGRDFDDHEWATGPVVGIRGDF